MSALDALDRWLDPAWVGATLAPRLAADPATGAAIGAGAIAIGDVHLKTFRKRPPAERAWLGVVYRFGRDGRPVYCRFHRPGTDCIAIDEHPPTLRLADLDALVWTFPDDPRLDALAANAVAPQCPQGARAAAIDIVHYRPGERCTARLRLDDGSVRYGKTYADGRAGCIAARHRALAGRLEVASPLAVASDGRTFWTDAIDGATLAAALAGRADQRAVAAAAASLATLHAQPHDRFEGLPRVSRAALFAEAENKLAKIAVAFPALAGLAAALAARLAPGARAGGGNAVPIHGDCHAGQWIVTPRGAVLLDLDELGAGEREQDLAGFVVDCAMLGLPAARARFAVHAFVAGYAGCSSPRPDPASLDWHIAVQRINKTHRGFVQRRLRRATQVAAGLAQAMSILVRHHSRGRR